MEKSTVYSFSSQKSLENKDFLLSLLAKAKGGNSAAFGEIYNLFFRKIFQFIYYRVGHKEIAEDLTEDTFVKAYTKLHTLADEHAFEGWLYQIARNRIIDYYREKKIFVPLEEVESILEYDSALIDNLILEDDQRAILRLFSQLEPDQRSVLKMKFFEHLENAEIAAILQKTEGAIRVIQHRAITKLKTLLQQSPRHDT